jgi:bifunctional DNase/RNase
MTCDFPNCESVAEVHDYRVNRYQYSRIDHFCERHANVPSLRLPTGKVRDDHAMLQVELSRIVFFDRNDFHLFEFQHFATHNRFRLSIGTVEAWTIISLLSREKFRRPLTHQAFGETIIKLGGVLQSIQIVKFDEVDHFYYASLRIQRENDILVVDIRPSDAVALAVSFKLPIFVAKDFLIIVPSDEY